MTAALGWAVGAVLGIWFVGIVLANTRRTRPFLTRRDVAGLLPDWALFARPRIEDYVLLRRDVLRDGTLTRWAELEVAGHRRWYNFIWNPGLGPRRAQLALAAQIIRIGRPHRRGRRPHPGQGTVDAIGIMTSVPYLSLLKYVTTRSHAAVDATQFMIVSVPDQALTGRRGPGELGAVVFVSEFHAVGAVTSDPSSVDDRRFAHRAG